MPPIFQSPAADAVSVQVHSDSVDTELGFNIPQIERTLLNRAHQLDPHGDLTSWGKMLHEGSQTWIGLDHNTLLTPYDELHRMCEQLKISENGHVVDLGAAYGRMGFVLNAHCPTAYFTGIECVEERVNEGNRIFNMHGYERARLIQDNLFRADFNLPMADAYMIYDYGTLDHIRWSMGQLQNLAGIHRFKVIARGKGIRALIHYAHPWLSQIGEPYHEENFSVYSNYVD